jgi:hypothetical protein
MSRFIPSLTQAEEEMRQDRDNLRNRVEEWIGQDFDGAMTGELISDLWRWGQEQAAEATAWKHANAFEPVTAEELDVVLMDADRAGRLIEILGPLYRQRKR